MKINSLNTNWKIIEITLMGGRKDETQYNCNANRRMGMGSFKFLMKL